MSSYPGSSEDIARGDIVAIQHGQYGRREGLVIGSHIDYAGRQIVEVQLEPGEIYNAWYPTVTRVKRTISYAHPRQTSTGRSSVTSIGEPQLPREMSIRLCVDRACS
ncbi:hypothetical protein A0H81_09764 [Grifola frondosa]|uniref:Uncharacterized protein n=1 Tax=Grifola frondosa TaxID=5627 RepID=A0A1C7M085_GRIFR|nr:hypothetical protein A0H81_09764 [Grifola frondosa]